MSARFKAYSGPADNPFVIAKKKSINIIGLNSGTSADGLDIALIRFSGSKPPDILKRKTYPFPESLKKEIISAGEPEFSDGVEWLRLDIEFGHIMGELTRKFLQNIRKSRLSADIIGSHGQTVRHLPADFKYPLTLQIGDPAALAKISGLPVVADFRRSDLAAGGQGAPLSPLLHQILFRHKTKWRAIVNIGGISNATILPPEGYNAPVLAGDCGPGNMLIDSAMMTLFKRPYDLYGAIALKGHPPMNVVSRVLRHRFFELALPKSTGRELFGRKFLDEILHTMSADSPEDIISTVSEITVAGIVEFIERFGRKSKEVYLCGGGSRNRYIIQRLRQAMPDRYISTTAELGHDPDHLESLLWAYMALKFIKQEPVNAKHFTGAKTPYIPGRLCLP